MKIPETMKAAVLFGPNDLRVVEKKVAKPGYQEVLLKVEACAICGTDPKILAHGWQNQPPFGELYSGTRICRDDRRPGRRGCRILQLETGLPSNPIRVAASVRTASEVSIRSVSIMATFPQATAIMGLLQTVAMPNTP